MEMTFVQATTFQQPREWRVLKLYGHDRSRKIVDRRNFLHRQRERRNLTVALLPGTEILGRSVCLR